MVKSWPADPAKNYHTCKILTRLGTPRADRAVHTVALASSPLLAEGRGYVRTVQVYGKKRKE